MRLIPRTYRGQAILLLSVFVGGLLAAFLLSRAGYPMLALLVFLAGYLIFTYMPLPHELREFEKLQQGK